MSRGPLLPGRLVVWSVRDAKGSVNAKTAQLGVWGVRDAKGSVTAKPEQCSWPEDCGKGSIYHT